MRRADTRRALCQCRTARRQRRQEWQRRTNVRQTVTSPARPKRIRGRRSKLRPLAVTTTTRWEGLPDIPAVGDFVPGYEASAVNGIGAPSDTPVEIIEKLNKEINAALADTTMKAKLADLGATTIPGSAAEYVKLIADETEKWSKVVKFSGAKPD
jgi:tripartite-type tricarboxylate transporter receptor subunit TctC